MRNNDPDDDKPLPNRPRQEKAEDMKLWGILIFGLIGATATTFAVSCRILPGIRNPFRFIIVFREKFFVLVEFSEQKSLILYKS